MSNALPTRELLRCGGISMILTQILFIIAFSLHSMDFDYYSVQNEDEVITLHDQLSSDVYRIQTQIAVSCLWCSYPFLLITLHSFKKFALALLENTYGELFTFCFEKSLVIFMTVSIIIIPALALVSCSYDWSFHETTAGDTIPTGYYIQLYVVQLEMELLDCLAIADAGFMISVFLCVRVMLYHSKSSTLKKFREIILPKIYYKIKTCAEILVTFFAVSLFIIFMIVLFEFAKSGFFSPTGHAKFLFIWSFILKIYMGVRIFMITTKTKWGRIEAIFDKANTMLELDTNKS